MSFHAWPSATLAELSHQLAATSPHLLPSPAIGTRLAFRLLYYDTRAAGDQDQGPARCVVKDLGSVVIGDGGPGISTDVDDDNAGGAEAEDGRLRMGATAGSAAESAKSLADARFVVGDFLSCAILPPSPADGSVQPASAARAGRGYGAGQARNAVDLGPPPPMSRGGGRDAWSAPMYGPRGGGGGASSFRAPPVGEWRRGEKLPEGPPGRGRGGRRW